MKNLKGFVRQRAQTKGPMDEGWLVQESCVFVPDYLSCSQKNKSKLQSTRDNDWLLGDVPQGNGVVKQSSEEMQTKFNNYCMMNNDVMQRWYEMYERTRQEWMHA